MANEAALPGLGWLAVASLPALGFWLSQTRGLATGAGGAALIVLGPIVVKTGWSIDYPIQSIGYLLAVSVLTLVSLPLFFTKMETIGAGLSIFSILAAACVIQFLALRRGGERALLIVFVIEVLFFGLLCAIHSHIRPIEVELGYTGIVELLAYMNSITVLTLCAIFGLRVANRRNPRISSI